MNSFYKSIALCFVLLLPMMASGKVVVTEKNYADTIPFAYRNGQILVPITIKGQTYHFLYDTGATACMLPDTLDHLFVEEKKSRKITSADNVKSEKLKSGILSEMTLGNLHINGMRCVLQKPNGSNMFILGADLLYNSGIIAKIDVKKKLLILTDRKKHFQDEKGYEIPLSVTMTLPKLKFRLSDGCTGRAIFDSGNNSLFMISRKYYDESVNGKTGEDFKQQVLWSDFGSTLIGANGAEAASEKIVMKMKEVKMKNVTLRDVPVSVMETYTGFGTELLEYGSMIINPKEFCLYFQPYEEDNGVVQLKERDSFAGYNIQDGKIKVELIDTNSELYRKGVRKGDYLIEVNGVPVNSYDDYIKVSENVNRKDVNILRYRTASGDIVELSLPAIE